MKKVRVITAEEAALMVKDERFQPQISNILLS